MKENFIKCDNGLKIHYKEFGKGPTLLLLHGWNNDWSGFSPLIDHLEDQFHVIAVDLPGYGKSDPLEEDYSVEKLSDVLSEFITKKSKSNVDILCALSMGTVIAGDLSNRHSEKIKSVILIGPPIIKYDWKLSKLYRDWIKFMNKSPFLMYLGHKIMASSWYGHMTAKHLNMHKYNKEIVDKYGMEGRKNINAKVLFQMGKAMYYFHLEKTLRKVKIPMLVILGRYDKLVNLSEAARIGKNRDNVKVRWVEDAGHVVSLEDPEKTAELVKEFAKDLKFL